MKIVVNRCFGGFGLSPRAVREYAKKKNIKIYAYVTDRNDYNKYIPYNDSEEYFGVCYFTKEITSGEFDDNSYFSARDIERNDPLLVEVVEQLGEEANGSCAFLQVVNIPDGIDWYVDDYDGSETIREKHRSW